MQLVCSGAAGAGSNAYDSAYCIRTIGDGASCAASPRDWNQSCRYYSWFETTKSMIQEGPSNLTPGRHIVPPRICGDFLFESERGKGKKGEGKERAHTIHNSRT
ncbi:hypothetical protein BDV39DRAFT_79956 [Aspergillus sergii]|uniref:Uncharacterized protein n=1 Tax=Aspergillus sergii TaxID=1034303 RepID=A0A5N6X3F9_9EURO|nr:hypothetical protein BDV39DRAFT_79956 [Aspergillus sergii]